MKMKERTIFILAIILILAGIAGAYIVKQKNTMLLQGEVEVKTVNLSSKIAGRAIKINVEKGQEVKKGDILAELSTPDIDAKAQQAEATLALAVAQQEKVNNGARTEQLLMAKSSYELAQKTYERLNNLHKEGVIPTQKLDEAKTKYDTAKEQYQMLLRGSRIEDKASAAANVRKAQSATKEVNSYLTESKIISPIDGIVTEVNAEEGELIGPGFPVITIIDNNNTWVTFNIREDLLSKITNGKEFDVKIPAIGDQPVRVRVNYISVLGNFATWRATKARGDFDLKTFEVRAVPVEPVNNLRAGMSVIFDWKKL